MKIAYWSTILLIVLLSMNATSFAQMNTTWKKQVGREIYDTVKEDDKKHHLKDLSNDSTLLEVIIAKLKAGNITAYSNYDNSFTTILSPAELNQILVPLPDTIMITDPVTGQEIMRVRRREFDYSSVHKYRILEDWTFNPLTGNTDIHIEGIAPVRDVYVDGEFRGYQALFWVRYNDVLPVLRHYDQYHPDNTLAAHIWNDYFYSDVKPAPVK